MSNFDPLLGVGGSGELRRSKIVPIERPSHAQSYSTSIHRYEYLAPFGHKTQRGRQTTVRTMGIGRIWNSIGGLKEKQRVRRADKRWRNYSFCERCRSIWFRSFGQRWSRRRTPPDTEFAIDSANLSSVETADRSGRPVPRPWWLPLHLSGTPPPPGHRRRPKTGRASPIDGSSRPGRSPAMREQGRDSGGVRPKEDRIWIVLAGPAESHIGTLMKWKPRSK